MSMQPKKLIIATDHRGYELKEFLKTVVKTAHNIPVTWTDVGAYNAERSDYPIFAHAAIKKLHEQQYDGIVLLCGSGNGMAISANRFKGIYACVCWNPLIARQAKEDDNCNVLVLAADDMTQAESVEILSAWLHATFKSGRYAQRLEQLDAL